MSGDHMVTTARLTKRVIENLPAKSDRYVVRDSELKGFGVRVSPQGRKTYLVRYRTTGRADRLMVLAPHSVLTTEEAREHARRALAAAAMGGDPQGIKAERRAEMTVAELCELYMAEGTATKKSTTLQLDRIRIDRHINPRIGNRKVTAITRGDIQRLMIDVGNGNIRGATTPHTRGGKGAAARTVGLLGGIFTFAQERGFVEANPVRGLKRYKDNRRERFLSAAELGRLGDLLTSLEKDGRSATCGDHPPASPHGRAQERDRPASMERSRSGKGAAEAKGFQDRSQDHTSRRAGGGPIQDTAEGPFDLGVPRPTPRWPAGRQPGLGLGDNAQQGGDPGCEDP